MIFGNHWKNQLFQIYIIKGFFKKKFPYLYILRKSWHDKILIVIENDKKNLTW